jgi:hypothetical protein
LRRNIEENFRNTEITAAEVSVIACCGTTGLPRGGACPVYTDGSGSHYGSAVKLINEDVV